MQATTAQLGHNKQPNMRKIVIKFYILYENNEHKIIIIISMYIFTLVASHAGLGTENYSKLRK